MSYSYLYPPCILLIDWATGHGWPPMHILPGVVLIALAMAVVQMGQGDLCAPGKGTLFANKRP